LNLPDLVPVQQHPVVSAPSAKGFDLAARLYPYVRFHRLLKRHDEKHLLWNPAHSGVLSGQTKGYEKKRILSSPFLLFCKSFFGY
jgi:hypothetical protein